MDYAVIFLGKNRSMISNSVYIWFLFSAIWRSFGKLCTRLLKRFGRDIQTIYSSHAMWLKVLAVRNDWIGFEAVDRRKECMLTRKWAFLTEKIYSMAPFEEVKRFLFIHSKELFCSLWCSRKYNVAFNLIKATRCNKLLYLNYVASSVTKLYKVFSKRIDEDLPVVTHL